jgi:hypothetical protein|tara:strand:+ start:452 stop:934 length:483 start_codon:yes stop_codon:yes gene_type:complete
MKKLLSIVVLVFIVSCSPSAEKIIPKEGLFTKANKEYLMFCTIEFHGRDTSLFQDYKFAFKNDEVFYFQIEDWEPTPVTVYSSGNTHIDFGIKGDESSLYVFDKIDGSLSASAHAHGGCHDKDGGWTYVMEDNTLVYTRPHIRSPGLFERIEFKIKKILN